MRYIATSLLLIISLVACREASILDAPKARQNGDLPSETSAAMVMSEIEFYLYSTKASGDLAVKPNFRLRAASGQLDELNVYSFKDARAVIFNDKDNRDIHLQAQRGLFNKDKKAYLEDDVHVQVGEMNIDLEEVIWENPAQDTEGVARSNGPVHIDAPYLQLDAASLRLYPDTEKWEVTEMKATIPLRKE
jgi:hypothetical protein